MYKFNSVSPATGIEFRLQPLDINTRAVTAFSVWGSNELTYAFPESVDYYEDKIRDIDSEQFRPADEGWQKAFAYALGNFSSVSNLSFTESSNENRADIAFSTVHEENRTGGGYGFSPDDPNGFEGSVWVDDLLGPQKIGDRAHFLLLHELGHALGLKHAHETQERDGIIRNALDFAKNSTEFSVMTYVSYVGGPANFTNQYFSFSQTLMMYDIAAVQFMYGANFNSQSGNNVYTFNPQTGEMSIDGVGQGTPGANRIFRTIWDGNGNDTYDLSNYTTNLNIDLRPGGWSVFSESQLADLGDNHKARGNVFNALLYEDDPRSLIENATGGTGNDIIVGNRANNELIGNNGNDTLTGEFGVDTLDGGKGNDILHGDFQNNNFQGDGDYLYGREDDDKLYGGGGNDHLYGGIGADYHEGGDGVDYARYDDLDHGDLIISLIKPSTNSGAAKGDTYLNIEGIIGGAGKDHITGDHSTNYLVGGAQNDAIFGLDGNDHLFGGLGGDDLFGGFGEDYLYGGDDDGIDYARYDDAKYGDLVISLSDPSKNTGTAKGDKYYGIEGIVGGKGNDTITGADKKDDLKGGEGNDKIFGLNGDDNLLGGAGSDKLYGGIGADTLIGGDFFGVDFAHYDDANYGDLVINLTTSSANTGAAKGDKLFGIEGIVGGIGNDTITGASNGEFLKGGIGNDIIFGLAGNDTLEGQEGNDYLYGGLGKDTLIGGEDFDLARYDDQNYGNLTIYLDTPSKNVGAAAVGDTYIEIEGIAGGDGDDKIFGNAVDNQLYGGSGTDELSGGIGNDFLYGGLGADKHIGGTGIDLARYDDKDYGNLTIRLDTPSSNIGAVAVGDTYVEIEGIVGGIGNDIIYGDTGHNHLYGGAGKDELYGGAGSDALYGGLGADKFVGGDISGLDVVWYNDANYGNLTIRLDIAGANVGEAAVGDTYDGIEGLGGGDANDFIWGNSKDNELHGSHGNDYLYGHAGNDRLFGEVGADRFVFNQALNATTNVDTIFDFNPIDDTVLLAQSIFSKIGSALETSELRLGTAASDANDFVIFDRDTGKLYYDANANGAGGQTLFAQVSIGTLLDVSDFQMLA